MAADPPGFPSELGRRGRFGRTVRPRSAGPTGADRCRAGRQMRPKGSADVTRLAGVCEARGWFRAPYDLYRARAPDQPLRFPSAARAGTTCGEVERVSGPVRSPSPAQLGEHRAGSEGSGMRWRPRACEARWVEGGGPGQAGLGAEAGRVG